MLMPASASASHERRGDARVRPHARTDQGHLADVIVVEAQVEPGMSPCSAVSFSGDGPAHARA